MDMIYKDDKGIRIAAYARSPSTWKALSYVQSENATNDSNANQGDDKVYYAVTVELDTNSSRLRLHHFKQIQPTYRSLGVTSSFQINQVVCSTLQEERKCFEQILRSYDASIVRNMGKIKSTFHLR